MAEADDGRPARILPAHRQLQLFPDLQGGAGPGAAALHTVPVSAEFFSVDGSGIVAGRLVVC